jgi:uncharacterized protein (TIGR03086 family)
VDLVELYRRGVVGFTDRVRQVGPDRWSAPTPCAEWDVRALVNHVVYEQRWAVPLFEGATIAEVGDRFEGDLLGTDPVATATEAGHASIDAIAETGALNRTVHLSFGDTPATEYVSQLLADHLVHAWDLAVAIGADPALDPEAVRACAGWFAGREDLYRGGGAIGPRVDVPPERGEQAVLIGAFGRDPDWATSGLHRASG